VEDGVEIEGTLVEPAVVDLFRFILNDPQLFAIVDSLTGCGPIGCFTGRVYRRRASTRPGEQYYPWHNDIADDRMIGLSINLGREPFRGGVLQVRDAVTHAPIVEIANTVFGDAVLFRISDALEHQVTPVEGRVMRTVMAGWFRARPSYLDAFEDAKAEALP
jgi:Rps23 Pro-64 3,4-dihydroxylase Tpa1-like proline 4-hydroxylase